VTAAAAAVAALLEPGHRTLVSAIICLVGQPTPAEQPLPVEVTGLSDLRSSVRGDRRGWVRRRFRSSPNISGARSPVNVAPLRPRPPR
jgi:hypothetical protein